MQQDKNNKKRIHVAYTKIQTAINTCARAHTHIYTIAITHTQKHIKTLKH